MISRRDFLVAASAAALPSFGRENIPLDPNRVVLFSDNHLAGEKRERHQNLEMERSVREVLALRPRPANVLILGDLAWACGTTEDYRLNRVLLAPLASANIRVTLALGNHDRHATFAEVYPELLKASPVPQKLVSVVETPRADFILLDSCLDGPVPGAIDEVQRQWLEAKVQSAKKPFFVGSHHPINEVKLGPLLAASPLCAGYLHGHDHFWQTREFSARLPILCLPSVGYWGHIGYAVMELQSKQAVATSHITKFIDNTELEPPVLQNEQPHSPAWRIAIAARYEALYTDGCTWRVPLIK